MPLATLVGTDLHTLLAPRVQDAADRLAAQLDAEGEGPEGEDAQVRTAADVMHALWGTDDPDEQWWRTPLGRRCARALAHTSTETVTHQRAADMLGITRGSIAQMVHRGTLDRHPDGGVLLSSILQRLAR